ncbi:kinase-like protein [Gigaspora margarita]|uniref:Kinase-like protein n=1 Tax=Gigaspora margarita TaxID=4874 RepID=A0A8H4B4K8_GIGMA|nr:kinase-like protein [Gigaspora margarita]
MLREWIEKAISERSIRYFDYNEFSDFGKLGEGGFGLVYKAEWKDGGLTVALKCLKEEAELDEKTSKSFIHEGEREKPVEGTPLQYRKLYERCWNGDPYLRPEIKSILGILNQLIFEPSHHDIIQDLSEIWFKDAISELDIEHYDFNEFSNFQKVNPEMYKCEWKGGVTVMMQKTEIDENLDKKDYKEFVKELKVLLETANHPNIIGLYGITKDLNDINIMVHEGRMLISGFRLARKSKSAINSASYSAASVSSGVVAFIDPECFVDISYRRNYKSDVYSFGVILWEISSGRQPFKSEVDHSMFALVLRICQGSREEPVDGTPSQYCELYKQCWDSNHEQRPNMKLALRILNELISDNYVIL